MTPEDLAATHDAAFTMSRAWSAAEFASLLEAPGVILCGDARSYVLGRMILDEAEVLTVATAPAFQKQGLATAALGDFAAQAASAGVTSVFLEVADDNNTAKALYKKINFKISGRRRAYYTRKDGPAVDALIMRKEL
jgi:ribosomal-protein-alanine N-acetyltransferase